MKPLLLHFTLATATFLAGCTATLESRPLSPSAAREGIGYVLPFTQWAITSTWRLDYCPDRKNPEANSGKDATLAVKVEAIARSEDDGGLAFVINPQDLQTLTSITTFNTKWHDGRNLISSINASVEDRTGQIVGNLAKTVVKIIPLTGIPNAPGGQGTPRSATIFCSDDAAKALDSAQTAKASLQARQGILKTANAALAAISRKAAAMGDSVDESTKQALSAAFDAVVKATREQSVAEEVLADSVKEISFSRIVAWPQDGDVFSGGPLRMDEKKFAAWLTPSSELPMIFFQVERTGSFGRATARLDLRPSDVLRRLPVDSDNPTLASPGSDPYQIPDTSSKGLRYRMPARGVLVVCWRSPCSAQDYAGRVAAFEGPVAQLGYVNVLPFRSRAFGSNAFTAEINIDGSLKSVGYEQKAAPAEVATGAIADATTQVAAVLDPTARLQAGNAYLKALKERRAALEALKDDPIADETSILDSETALLNAELERLKAEIALEELRAMRSQ